jgi:hypothetical protein
MTDTIWFVTDVVHTAVLVYVAVTVRGIARRSAAADDELHHRTADVEAKAEKLAAEVATREADAKVRHDKMIANSLAAREAAETAKDVAVDTKNEVTGKLDELIATGAAHTVVELSPDTIAAVHEIAKGKHEDKP